MAKPKLVLYLDLVSPFAYLAFYVIHTSPVFRDCDVTYVPILLGGVMNATKNTPPIKIKKKGEWVNRERLRWANLFGVPMAKEMPPGFPNNTIPVQRALIALSLLKPEQLADTLAVLYYTSFAKRQDIHTLENLNPIFTRLFGEAAAKNILSKATSDEVKKMLVSKTDEALAEGSFGLPWYVATNSEGEKESYWGFDHIAQVADHLGLERPRPGSSQEGGWKAML